jgi:short-subunit dehydrogenase
MASHAGAEESSDQRVILITGASAGLGKELARALVHQNRAGALVLTARRLDRLEELASELKKGRPDFPILTLAADLADPLAPAYLVDETTRRFGGLDVLVNNAGLGLPTLFEGAEPDQLARQLAVNLTAPLLLTRLCLPSLVARNGMVINIGSAITCVANSALGAYGATKAALAYWNDALRRELARTGVKICLVEPGPVRTEFMDALTSMLPEGGRTHPILDNSAPWMSADAPEVARRIARLVDHPRRRLSVPKRFVWPFRVLGFLARLCPPLGDRLVIAMQRQETHERESPAKERSIAR